MDIVRGTFSSNINTLINTCCHCFIFRSPLNNTLTAFLIYELENDTNHGTVHKARCKLTTLHHYCFTFIALHKQNRATAIDACEYNNTMCQLQSSDREVQSTAGIANQGGC